MERNLSPILLRELENLEKDADSRKSAMKALQTYVKGLDCNTIPIFLAQVSETKEIGSLSEEFIISLYEVLARIHGVKIVPMIDNIMASIVQTLASSSGSFTLHQACSKVVPTIARYGIDPTTSEEKKRHIIHSLCKPLSDSLPSSQESLTSGAALCLSALVDSDNWRFASDEMVNRVCQNVAVALEGKSTQVNSHMGLVMALAKHNALVVEAYARLLIQSGLRILNTGLEVGNSQKRLAAIQMLNFLMKFLDPRSVTSELELIIEEMEKCQSDIMVYVRGAAFEALQTAKRISIDRKSRFGKSSGSITGSNFREGEDISDDEDLSPASISPESRILDYFPGYESITESPIPTSQASQNFNYERRSLNRKFQTHEYGRVVQRSRPQVNMDSIKIFSTPRKHTHSLQDPNGENSGCSENQCRGFRSPSSSYIDWSTTSRSNQNLFLHNMRHKSNDNESLYADIQFQGGPESVSSTEDLPADADMQASPKVVVPGKRNDTDTTVHVKKALRRTKLKLVYGLSFVLLAMATPLLWINIQEEGHYLVPT
ncbi:protein SINE1-like [Senna tora]|uniref:Protein SINE1-like n=1 Tax=Senna tora TaxID=362788 RepID=A0A834WE40_9FABA|nr:protein SINE1-like [Senna tora]